MSAALPIYPFDAQLCIGTIAEVNATTAKANLPKATTPADQWHHGHKQGRGDVGDFITIECGREALFGRIVSVKLPERERLSVEPELGRQREVHPLGVIQLLSTVALDTGRVCGGITTYPRLGARVYAAHPLFVKWVAETTQQPTTIHHTPVLLDLASIPAADGTTLAVSPERLFGRHCAVLGTTGGGKSWTLARIIEQAAQHDAKILLLDATGEFHTLRAGVQHVAIGASTLEPPNATDVAFPYNELTEGDLFALFKPSGQIQAPKLRGAMRTLKLARATETITPALARNGVIKKSERLKQPFLDAYRQNVARIEDSRADFDITCLAQQINEECIYLNGGTAQQPDSTRWGRYNETERSYCVSLITRIDDMLHSRELHCVLKPEQRPSFTTTLDAFLADTGTRILRVSLRHLSFTHDVRHIVANAIGRHLLNLAREDRFRNNPLLVVLDEAHQFLDKVLGDENTRYPLDAFELIAKEGRKYAVNLCLATQRPRDVPEGVLSQMGTLIVHRLINDRDREVVERASGEIDRSAAEFLPTLAPGQAVIIGVDFPIPLTIQIRRPTAEPDWRGPDYQEYWHRTPTAMGTAQQSEEGMVEPQPQ